MPGEIYREMNENSCAIKLVHRNFFHTTTTHKGTFSIHHTEHKEWKSFANKKLRPQAKSPVEIEAKSNQFESSVYCVIFLFKF